MSSVLAPMPYPAGMYSNANTSRIGQRGQGAPFQRAALPPRPLCARGARPPRAASSDPWREDGPVGVPSEVASTEQAAAAVKACVDLCCSGQLEGLIDYLPDEVLDRAIARKRAKLEGVTGTTPAAGEVTCNFAELVDGAQPSDITIDAFALRTLVLAPPAAAPPPTPLSCLRLGPDRCIQRYAVTASSGEEAVLTFDMQLQEAVIPQYKSIRVTKRWFLRAITGEPASPGPPSAPGCKHGPEAVVAAQLEALRLRNPVGVFKFASPANQEATGPLERFTQMLTSPPYSCLLGHRASEVLRSVQMSRDKALVIVGVTTNLMAGGQVLPWGEVAMQSPPPPTPQKAVFTWDLGLQPSGPLAGCWLTEAVRPLSGDAAQLFRF